MRRSAGYSLLELVAALALITVATSATLPTLLRTSTLAREVDARLEDSEALSRARRRLAVDLRAAEQTAVTDGGLRITLAGEDVEWHADEDDLRRAHEPVSRRVTALRTESGDVLRVTLSTASRDRTFAVAPRTTEAAR